MMEKKHSFITVVARAFGIVLKEAPIAFLGMFFVNLLLGTLSGITAPVNEYLYDSIEAYILHDGLARNVYIGAIAVVVIIFVTQLINFFNNILSDYTNNHINVKLSKRLYRKVSALPAQSFEDPEFIQNISQAASVSSGTIQMFVETWLNLIVYNLAFFSIMATYLGQMEPILILPLIIAFIPTILSNWILPMIENIQNKEARALNMEADAYKEHAANPYDTRMFGAFNRFYKMYYDVKLLIFEKERGYKRKKLLINFALDMSKVVGWSVIVFLLFRSLMNQTISVGGFAAVLTSTELVFSNVENFFSQISIGTMFTMFIEDYLAFNDLPDGTVGSHNKPDFSKNGVTATNVSFSYPGTDVPAVNNVSLNIGVGETVAIVGENGSGKTTLAKLLCGLYKPDNGSISIGGNDSASTANKALFSRTSAIFQDYMQYFGLDLDKNVRISDFSKKDSSDSAIESANVPVNDKETLPNGTSTILGREFENGVQLSGGQWQRIAIARGIYRDSDFIILDEPTSAIDPIEETRIYKQFAEYSRDKSTVLITHRLGSVKIADRIIVMDKGSVIEEGTHDELLQKHGRYFEMWEAQSAAYKS